jgi:serine/threonine-protein kinase
MGVVSAERMAFLRVGRVVKGKWRLDRLIGCGGMAAVYEATHRNGAKVAIKMLHPGASRSPQVCARFQQEGYLANKVGHENVVRVLDDDVDDVDSCAFLVMDLVVGQTLSERGLQKLLTPGELLAVAEQVLSVLESAHAQSIVHRDIKPDNLLIESSGRVRVLDFGIARLQQDETANLGFVGGLTTNRNITRAGVSFGTPGFMAPEQAEGRLEQIGPHTDIYSLGATLFALASGEFVLKSDDPAEIATRVATEDPRSLAEVAPLYPPAVVALVDRAVRREPAERWPNARAMLDEVQRVRAELGLEPSALSTAPNTPPSSGNPPAPAQMMTITEPRTARSWLPIYVTGGVVIAATMTLFAGWALWFSHAKSAQNAITAVGVSSSVVSVSPSSRSVSPSAENAPFALDSTSPPAPGASASMSASPPNQTATSASQSTSVLKIVYIPRPAGAPSARPSVPKAQNAGY